MLKFLKQLFCLHVYEYDLSQSKGEYHYVKECRKCHKTLEEFM